MQLSNGTWFRAEYSTFIVDSEATKYQLTVGGYSGDAGHGMSTANGMMFTTFDSDNDVSGNNCAARRGGGFWWKKCGKAHITTYENGDPIGGYFWKTLPDNDIELKTSRS